MTPAERAEWDAHLEDMQRHSDWLRDMAERGLAKLEGRAPRTEFPPHHVLMQENIERTRRLAERGLAELQRREQAG